MVNLETTPVKPQRFGEVLVQLGLVTEPQLKQALALQPLTGARVGEALVSLGFLTRTQLQRAVSLNIKKGQDVTVTSKPRVGEILLGLQYIDKATLESGLEEQQATNRRLGEVLIDRGVINHKQLFEALGIQRIAQPAPWQALNEFPRTQPNGRRIMVIDDSELSCELVKQGLSALGYAVTTFVDPYLALEQLELLKPDLVLSDLEMPTISGVELCERLKKGTRMLPVIIFSANDFETSRAIGAAAGADDFVDKGAPMEEIAGQIESVLKRSSENERARRIFSRHTTEAVISEMVRAGEVVITGERREVTSLVVEVRSLLPWETRDPGEVIYELNLLLADLAEIVFERGGTLEKFLGAGLMAVWGAPLSRYEDVESALLTAMKMVETVRVRNERSLTPLELGIGLNSGVVIAGAVGNNRATEYACIGDAVELASHLASIAGPGDILIGDGTARNRLDQRDLIRARELRAALEVLEPVRISGRAQPVQAYRPTAKLAELLRPPF